jgi:hypothetical protein
MPKKVILTGCCVLGLLLLISACQSVPGFNLFSTVQEPDQAAPRSNFVQAQQVLLAQVGQPVVIESHHVGSTLLKSVEIMINGQPVRTEATAGLSNAFPTNLVTVQVLVLREQTPSLNRQAFDDAYSRSLTFISPACQSLAKAGGAIQTNAVPVDISTSMWHLCHIWIGHVPGTYTFSVQAIDKDGRPGQPIVQHIEVR